jgi:hypothetical protein
MGGRRDIVGRGAMRLALVGLGSGYVQKVVTSGNDPEPECRPRMVIFTALPAQYLIENTHLSGNDRLTLFRTPGQLSAAWLARGLWRSSGDSAKALLQREV